jgi:uncharacterized protein (TIGR00725 family)
MKQRRIVIGAIGGNRQKIAAVAFGKAVAEAGCILLTGGRIRDSDEVKDAAMVGAVSAEASGSVARLVGILPSDKMGWDETRNRSLFLETGLAHNLRNVINGLTPDVLVIFGGSKGTLAEAAFAVAANKQLFFSGPSVIERLRSNFNTYFVGSNYDQHACLEEYLRMPMIAYRDAWNRSLTVGELTAGLANLLVKASEIAVTPTELVSSCIAAATKAGPLGQTGFPGLPIDPCAKSRFEAIIERISK